MLKRLSIGHPKVVWGSVALFTVIFTLAGLSANALITGVIMGLINGLIIGYLLVLIIVTIRKLWEFISVSSNSEPSKINDRKVVETKPKEDFSQSANEIVKQKEPKSQIKLHNDDLAPKPQFDIPKDGKRVDLTGKQTIHCDSCGKITNILNRVQFKDGFLCADCLQKHNLKKHIELDLWAKDHSWKEAIKYQQDEIKG